MLAVKSKIIYTGRPEPPIPNAYLCFNAETGKIVSINRERPKCEIVAEGEVLTPAFIDAHSHIGMRRSSEPPAEEETNEKMDSIISLADALDSIYMDDRAFKESIEQGVLYSCVLPGSGNVIGGKAVVIRNYSKSTRDAFIRYAGIKAALGYNPRSTTGWKGTRPFTRMGALTLLRRVLLKARNEMTLVEKGKKEYEEVEPDISALFPVLRREIKLRVHAHKIDDILALFRIKEEFGLDVTIEHGCDLHDETAFEVIKEEKVPLVYGPIDAFPYKVELKHESWRNIEKLLRVKPFFGLMSDHPVVLQRNLFLQMRFFRRFGASKEECISILTLRNAKILGIDDVLGTLDVDKWASFILWNGDPFSLESYPLLVYAEGKRVHEEL